MSQKFEMTLREKSIYDKVRSQVRAKEKQLERLREVLQKEMAWKHESEELKDHLDAQL